jgi:hypothetical protein
MQYGFIDYLSKQSKIVKSIVVDALHEAHLHNDDCYISITWYSGSTASGLSLSLIMQYDFVPHERQVYLI